MRLFATSLHVTGSSGARAGEFSGTAFPGNTLTSTRAGQWAVNGVPVSGEAGTTFVIPFSVNIDDVITQASASNSLAVLAWPSELIAFWDFSEASAPFLAKEGTSTFPLQQGSGASVTVAAEGPFGQAVVFDGSTDFLRLPAASVGELNLSTFGNECTVLSWVKRGSDNVGFIGGMWQEDNAAPKRQYGLFVDLPLYGGDNRVCGHISKTGTATTGYPFAREYSASRRRIQIGTDYRFLGMTYDGSQIVSLIDGLPDSYPTYTDPLGNTYSKNPFLFSDGLNSTSISDFTVGAVKLTAGFGNFFQGNIGGLAVFKKALSTREIMWINRQLQPSGLPIIKHEFLSVEAHEGTESYANTFGWKAVRSTAATSTVGTLTAQNFESILLNSRHFLFRAGNNTGNTNTTLPAMGYFDQMKGIDFSQIGSAKFLLNNSHAADTIRFCVRIGSTWYASAATYSVTGDGRVGSNWTTAEEKTVTFTRAANTWRALTLVEGTTLTLGSVIATEIADGEVTGVGFYNANLVGSTSIVRIGTLEIFR